MTAIKTLGIILLFAAIGLLLPTPETSAQLRPGNRFPVRLPLGTVINDTAGDGIVTITDSGATGAARINLGGNGVGGVMIRHGGGGFLEFVNTTQDAYISVISGNMVIGEGFFEMLETADPAAPVANRVRLYIRDNGSGKTQLMALFSSGAAQQVAIQP